MNQRHAHATKRGPARIHKDGTHRNGKQKPAMSFAAGIANAAANNRAEVIKGRTFHDENGAYTRVGRTLSFNGETIRRMWLAGISAQRGY